MIATESGDGARAKCSAIAASTPSGSSPPSPWVRPGRADTRNSWRSKVSAAAAQRPEEVRIFVGRRAHYPSLGRDHIDRDNVVTGRSMYSHQPSIAAAERESRNSDFGVGTTDGREAIRLGGVIDLTPARAAFGADPSRLRIDAHLAHPRGIDHQTVVAYSGASAGMAAAADGGQDSALARKRTQTAMSSTLMQYAIAPGWRSTSPFHTLRAEIP
jgi:hypothetical protein